jgi:hypothetical protein
MISSVDEQLVRLIGTDKASVIGNTLSDSSDYAFRASTSNDITVEGNIADNVGSSGVRVFWCESDCTGETVASGNILTPHASSSHGIVGFDIINGNNIAGGGASGIVGGSVIVANNIDTPGGYGITLTGTAGICSLNRIISPTNRGITGDDIEDFVITNNYVSGSFIGIDLTGTANYNIIANNNLRESNTTAISSLGNNDVLRDNLGADDYKTLAAGTASYTVSGYEGLVECDTDGAQALTITLPTISSDIWGRLLIFAFVTDGGQNVTINRGGTNTIDDAGDAANTSITMQDAGDFIALQPVSTRWLVVKNIGCTLA